MVTRTTTTTRGDSYQEKSEYSLPTGSRLCESSSNRTRLVLFLLTSILLLPIMNKAIAVELAPHLYKTTLDNGLTVLVKESPATKVATVQIWVKAGSVYEEPNEGGITHLIEHMIFKGTPSRKAGEVAGAIEEAGGSINATRSTMLPFPPETGNWPWKFFPMPSSTQPSIPTNLNAKRKLYLKRYPCVRTAPRPGCSRS